jgi:hypothetical protein
MLLFYSRVTPKVLLFKVGEEGDGTVKVRNLLLLLFFVCHLCACIWYYLGRAVSFQPKMTWVFADPIYAGQNFNMILFMETIVLTHYWIQTEQICNFV